MNKYITTIRASVALAAVATLVALAPQANAALTASQINALGNSANPSGAKSKGGRPTQAVLAARMAQEAKKMLNAPGLTDAQKAALAKDIVAHVAKTFPNYANVVVGTLAKENPASAPALAAAAAQANSEVAAAVAKSAAAAAPAYRDQIQTQVVAMLGGQGLSTTAIIQAVADGVNAAGQGEVQANTVITNPADVSTSSRL